MKQSYLYRNWKNGWTASLFPVDFEGEESTTPSAFNEGLIRRAVVVELSPAAYDPSSTHSSNVNPFERAAEIAASYAQELARTQIADLPDGAGEVTRLDGLPQAVQNLEPDIDDKEVRAWLINS